MKIIDTHKMGRNNTVNLHTLTLQILVTTKILPYSLTSNFKIFEMRAVEMT